MRKSRFSETQIVGILRDAETGVPVPDLLRTHGVSKATFFKCGASTGARRSQVDPSRLDGCRQTLDVERVRPQPTRRQSVTETRSHGFDSLRLHHFHCMRSVSTVPASSKVACGTAPAAEQAHTPEEVQERPARRFGSLVPLSARHAYASLADARSSFGDNGSRDDGAPQR